MVQYKYDGWGNCKVCNANGTEITDTNHIGSLNPFRYRSYYFDTETKFYFLQSRYYDPEIGRFLTIDDISYLAPDNVNGLNLYAYCGNNPVMRIDPNGTWDWGTFWRGLGSSLAIVGGIALCFVPGAQALGAGLIIAGAGGLIGGAIGMAAGVGFNAGWDIGTIIGGAIGLIVAAPQLLGLTLTLNLPSALVLIGSDVVASVAVTIPIGEVIGVATAAGILQFAYDRKSAAPRIKSNSKKKAYDKAFQKGGKKEPIYHSNGRYGPHFHPADPKYKHWHYYFAWLLSLLGIEDND